MNALLECSMEIGQMNFKVMSILDAGETSKYGHPTPTQVNVKATAGKCILISGHDLKDLYNLLEQTEGTGVNVYTHGEMLPAHGYPERLAESASGVRSFPWPHRDDLELHHRPNRRRL